MPRAIASRFEARQSWSALARIILILALVTSLRAQTPPPPKPDIEPEVEWICPMDKDIRLNAPGFCPRCGMKLVPGIPEAIEFPVQIIPKPKAIKPGEDIELDFRVLDPHTGKTVRDFEIVHDRFFHLFVVSQDTTFFAHEHPEQLPDGSFRFHLKFPKPAAYRILCDFYPKGATPQLISNTLIVPGKGFQLSPASLTPNLQPQHSANLDAELVTEPAQPIAGAQTLMFFRLKPNDGIEQYLSAWGHMMAASWDLIDMIHTHPIYVTDPVPSAEGAAYKQIQFNLIFPRAGIYRLWVQFQRKGVVNTVTFDVPVSELK